MTKRAKTRNPRLRPSFWVGRTVQARVTTTTRGARFDPQTRRPRTVTCHVHVRTEVAGWTQHPDGTLLLDLAGYGMVAASHCDPIRWWTLRRW